MTNVTQLAVSQPLAQGWCPSVRAIIVNYNAGPLLRDCVEHLMASTVPVEIVVVDNASTDASLAGLADLVGQPGSPQIVRNPDNRGFSRANNPALAATECEFALLLNPDCLVEPETLERVLTALRDDQRAGMAGCLIRNPDGSEQAGCRRLTPTPGRMLAGLFGRGGMNLVGMPLPDGPASVEAISGAFMLVRRAAWEQVGLLDEGYFMHWEDLDWCRRFQLSGWLVLFVPEATATHVKGACGTAHPLRVEWHKHLGMIRYYDKFFRGRYALPVLWLIYLGVGVRFILKATAAGMVRARVAAMAGKS